MATAEQSNRSTRPLGTDGQDSLSQRRLKEANARILASRPSENVSKVVANIQSPSNRYPVCEVQRFLTAGFPRRQAMKLSVGWIRSIRSGITSETNSNSESVRDT